MRCKKCGENNAPLKKTCSNCHAFLEGKTINNVTGEIGYRHADGSFTSIKSHNNGMHRDLAGPSVKE